MVSICSQLWTLVGHSVGSLKNSLWSILWNCDCDYAFTPVGTSLMASRLLKQRMHSTLLYLMRMTLSILFQLAFKWILHMNPSGNLELLKMNTDCPVEFGQKTWNTNKKWKRQETGFLLKLRKKCDAIKAVYATVCMESEGLNDGGCVPDTQNSVGWELGSVFTASDWNVQCLWDAGEYVAVEKVESTYKKNPLVEQIWVYGSSFKHCLVAIVVPVKPALMKWASDNGINGSFEVVCKHPKAAAYVLGSTTKTARDAKLKGFEIAKAVRLETEHFSAENDLLTPTFKLKRPQLLKKYGEAVEALYAGLSWMWHMCVFSFHVYVHFWYGFVRNACRE